MYNVGLFHWGGDQECMPFCNSTTFWGCHGHSVTMAEHASSFLCFRLENTQKTKKKRWKEATVQHITYNLMASA